MKYTVHPRDILDDLLRYDRYWYFSYSPVLGIFSTYLQILIRYVKQPEQ